MGSATKARLWALRYGLAPDVRVAVFPLPEATAEDTGAAHVTFLQNFFDELRRKVPLGR